MARRRRRRSRSRTSPRSHRRTSRRTRRRAAGRKHVVIYKRVRGRRKKVADFWARRGAHGTAKTRRKSAAFLRNRKKLPKAARYCARTKHLRPGTSKFGACVKKWMHSH